MSSGPRDDHKKRQRLFYLMLAIAAASILAVFLITNDTKKRIVLTGIIVLHVGWHRWIRRPKDHR